MRTGSIIISVLCTIISCAQHEQKSDDGYQIDGTIKGLQDTVLYLGNYYGESTYLKDTATVNAQGTFRFSGKNKLPQGVYIVILEKTRLFDIAMSEDQHFSMSTSTESYIENMSIKGDEDNRLFFENMLFNMERNKEADPFVQILKDSLASEKNRKNAREEIKKIDDKVVLYQQKIITEYPNTITAKFIKAMKPIQPPSEIKKKEDGSPDPYAKYLYYRKHFFDNFDLSDDALIRLPKPLYSQKLEEYLERMIPPDADSITHAVKKLVTMVKENKETYKYLIWNILNYYQQPKIMGLDKVYVQLYDDYFASGEMDFWIAEAVKKNVKEYADKLRLSLIGNKAPNLIMQDQNLNLVSMYDLNKKYTLIYFFDPDCGHCKTETPKLVDFYNQNKDRFDLEVFAVSSDTSMQKMKNYIKELNMTWITVNGPRTTVGAYQNLYDAFSTPTIYIIDEKKNIIAKKPPIESLVPFLENYEKRKQKKQEAGKP